MVKQKDAWIEPFHVNAVCWDSDAKEFVRISNGNCTLDHSSPAAFAQSHATSGCQYAPHEAVALRVLGYEKDGKTPCIAWTYRAVRAAALSLCKEGTAFPIELATSGRV